MYRLTIRNPGNLLSVVIDREITAAELDRITGLLDSNDDTYLGLRVNDTVQYASYIRGNDQRIGHVVELEQPPVVIVAWPSGGKTRESARNLVLAGRPVEPSDVIDSDAETAARDADLSERHAAYHGIDPAEHAMMAAGDTID